MKRELTVKKVAAELHVLRFPAAAHPVKAHCLNCDVPLCLSQPDLGTPERLLGVCEQCGQWFLIDLTADLSQALLWRLPDIEVIRRLTYENPSEDTSTMSGDPQP
jgi:hypothetical protein